MEKTLDLKMPEVTELGIEELKETSGGGWMAKALGYIVGAMCETGYYNDVQIEAAGYTAFKNA